MDNIMLPLLILLSALFVSRIINEKATKALTQEKKAALIDLFSENRIWTYGILVTMIVLFYLSLKFEWLSPFYTYTIYIVLLVAYIIALSYFAYEKLKRNHFPDAYIRSYIIATSLRFLGIILFFIATVFR